MSDCGCKDTEVTVLGGRGSLLKLIRRAKEEPVKSETLHETPVIVIKESPIKKNKEKKTLSIEDEIEAKRLSYILNKIEQLRRNMREKSVFCQKEDDDIIK